jgi:hypothetical protein
MTTAIDIGSTMVKYARIDNSGTFIQAVPRDHDTGILRQVSGLLVANGHDDDLQICSSANGGLRAGVLCLTRRFSGLAAQNLATAAGCNVVYLHEYRENVTDLEPVDVLICAGSNSDAPGTALAQALKSFDPAEVSYQALVWACDRKLAPDGLLEQDTTIVVDVPLGQDLQLQSRELTQALRALYLDDLVHKDGIHELQSKYAVSIMPTPAIVNLAHQRIANREAAITFPTPFLLIDTGGATTDVHFGIELCAQEMSRVDGVFPDLGVVASRASTIVRLLEHPSLLDFLHVLAGDDAHRMLESLRDNSVNQNVLFYGCLFLALAELSASDNPATPKLEITRAAAIVVTGGASQVCETDTITRLINLLSENETSIPEVILDQEYLVWTIGILATPTSKTPVV